LIPENGFSIEEASILAIVGSSFFPSFLTNNNRCMDMKPVEYIIQLSTNLRELGSSLTSTPAVDLNSLNENFQPFVTNDAARSIVTSAAKTGGLFFFKTLFGLSSSKIVGTTLVIGGIIYIIRIQILGTLPSFENSYNRSMRENLFFIQESMMDIKKELKELKNSSSSSENPSVAKAFSIGLEAIKIAILGKDK